MPTYIFSFFFNLVERYLLIVKKIPKRRESEKTVYEADNCIATKQKFDEESNSCARAL